MSKGLRWIVELPSGVLGNRIAGLVGAGATAPDAALVEAAGEAIRCDLLAYLAEHGLSPTGSAWGRKSDGGIEVALEAADEESLVLIKMFASGWAPE